MPQITPPRAPHEMTEMVALPIAASYMPGEKGPFTLVWDKDDWCAVFSGNRRVWSCNGTFARAHFRCASSPDTEGAGRTGKSS